MRGGRYAVLAFEALRAPLLMSRIGNLQDFLDAVGPHQAAAVPPLPVPDDATSDVPAAPPDELILESVPVATGLGTAANAPVELDAVTAVTRFPPR